MRQALILDRSAPALFTWVFALLALLAVWAQPARADAGAEQYVQALADEVYAVLSDKSLDAAGKSAKLRAMVDAKVNVKQIAYFTLGKYRRDATPAELDEFVTVFKEYAIGLYEGRLTEYAGEKLTVTGSVDRSEKEVIVASDIPYPGQPEPFKLNWRVIKGDTGYSIIDVQIEGIWMAQDLREQFASIITQNGGKVAALISHLKSIAA